MGSDRAIAYIDGFNLYNGLLADNLQNCRWLNLHSLCQSLAPPGHNLEFVRYFTTRVRGNQGAHERQATFIDALRAVGGIEIDFGHFLSKDRRCRKCNHQWKLNEEKKTDVNIAVRMLDDAFDDQFDTALVISGDSDLVPPVESIKRRFPAKRVVVAFPPKRHSSELKRVADSYFTISRSKMRQNRLPPTVKDGSGGILRAPNGWLPSGT